MGSWRKMTIKIFAQKFQLDGFFWWFLGLWTTHSCRETFVTNLFTEISLLALTNIPRCLYPLSISALKSILSNYIPEAWLLIDLVWLNDYHYSVGFQHTFSLGYRFSARYALFAFTDYRVDILFLNSFKNRCV